ncbi:hypothetical protein [Pseudomonas sp. W2Jun17]|uniref:phage tail tip fiber protein n=1 Tax=Pseudomonas sp. W2Jun17 TaxID=1553460 RepID=UPI002005CAE9|nr:hypothetical protein [Pseudomonas sp. W2Jun17]
MSDPKFQAVGAQLSSLRVQIQTESVARVAAYAALAARIGSIEAARGGDIQSENYVPGVSGWKLEKDGTFEINSCTLGSAAKAPERQMVSVEVASWSKYDLPKNAANLLQFMQAELQKVPEQYRHAAEFEEFDASYGDESFNARLFLSYSRLETEEELADRLEKAKFAGTHISFKSGLMTFTKDGVVRFKIGNLNQPEPEKPQPFKVDGDQVFINETFLHEASITNAKIVPGGKLYAGTGLGSIIDPSRFEIASQHPELGGAFIAGDASNILDLLKGQIEVDNLGEALRDRIDKIYETVNEKVKEVIRSELRPGGLLHR